MESSIQEIVWLVFTYQARAEEGRGLRSVEDYVEEVRKSVEKYVPNSKEKLVVSGRGKV